MVDISNAQHACDLQHGYDAHFTTALKGCDQELDKLHNRIFKVGELLTEFRRIKSQEREGEEIDFTEMSGMIEEFADEIWPQIQQAHPDLNLTFPLPEGIQIGAVSLEMAQKIEETLTHVQTREEREVPRKTLNIEQASEKYRIIADVLRQVVQDESESSRRRIQNQLSR